MAIRKAVPVTIPTTFLTMALINSYRIMKNIFKLLLPMTVAAIAFVACNREEEFLTPKDEHQLNITVKATPDEVKSDNPDTKTYINSEKKILWGTNEYMKIGVYDGTATAWDNSSDATADLWNGDEQACFTFSITPKNASGNYTYYGIYPASAAVTSSNEDPAVYKVDLPATQNATASSYDPKAYILVARAESGKTEADADWDAYFRRGTALNKITLSNLPEDIKRVEITAPVGTKLVGRRYINLTDGTSGEVYSGANKVAVRYASKLDHTAAMDIWFTSWGVDLAEGANLTIMAVSDAHTYTRVLSAKAAGIHFKEGYLNTLSVNMSSAVEGENTELASGSYLILAKNNSNYYALKNAVAGTSRLASQSYTGSTSEYVYNSASDALVWTVTDTGDGTYTIVNDGKYVGWNSGNNAYCKAAAQDWTTTDYAMDITWDGTNSCYHVAVHKDNTRILQRNSTSAYFAFYTSDQQKNLIFVPARYDNRTAVTLHFEDENDNTVTAANLFTFNYDTFLGYDLVASPNEAAITSNIDWEVTGDTNSIISDFDEGVVVLSGNAGSATVTASFAGDENYLPAEKSYTITVTAPYSASEAYTAATTTAVSNTYVKGIVSQITTAYNNGKVTYQLSDDGLTTGNQLQIYSGTASSASDVVVGDCMIVKGTLQKYNNTTPQLNSGATIEYCLHAPTFSGTVNFETSTSVTLSAAAGATIYYTTDGTAPTSSSNVYSSALNLSATTTVKAIAVKDGLTTGVVSKTYTKVASYEVNFDDPDHGSITVKHGETTLTSGDSVPFGETITITATPDSGYELSTLVYNDGSDHDIKASKSFTMPSSDVSITATFAVVSKKDYYKLVTNISDFTEGNYVVAALKSTTATNKFYFGKATVSSGDWVVEGTGLTVAAVDGVRRFETKDLPDDAVEFTFTGNNTDGFTISNDGKFLYYTAASNRKLAFAAAGSTQKWKVATVNDALVTGGVSLSAVTASGNYTISENSTGDGAIRGYANTTVYRAIYIFKKVNE